MISQRIYSLQSEISQECLSCHLMCVPRLTPPCVSRCGPLLAGPGSGLRPVLLPQHHAHPSLTQQTDGPGDGLTNTFPRTRPLQRSQETPHTQQTHAHGRFLGHPVVSGWGTLGIKRRGGPTRWNRTLRLCSGGAGDFQPLRLHFLWRPIQICGASSDFFFFFKILTQIYLLPVKTITPRETLKNVVLHFWGAGGSQTSLPLGNKGAPL